MFQSRPSPSGQPVPQVGRALQCDATPVRVRPNGCWRSKRRAAIGSCPDMSSASQGRQPEPLGNSQIIGASTRTRAGLSLGPQVRRCEEPPAIGTGGPLPVPATEIGDWRYWPWSLMSELPSVGCASCWWLPVTSHLALPATRRRLNQLLPIRCGQTLGPVRLPPASRGRAQPEHAAAAGCLGVGHRCGECRPKPGHIRFCAREREVGRVNKARNLFSSRLVCPSKALEVRDVVRRKDPALGQRRLEDL
jgi:hypothetical protein